MAAARGGHVAVVTLLLINDASVLRFDKTSARSCLHMAARAGSAECVEAVLVAAKASHELRDSCPGNHALHMAARSGSVGTVLALLAWGADRTALNHSKLTPHALAVRAERERGWKSCAEAGKKALAEKGVRAERRGSGRAGAGKRGASGGAGAVPPRCDFKRVVALLNPKSPAPLVWPSPWAQLLARAPPHVVWLLRAALAQAGGEEAEGEGGAGRGEEKREKKEMKASGMKSREDGVERVGGGGLDGEVEEGSAGEGGEGGEMGNRQGGAESAEQQEGSSVVGEQSEHTRGEQGGRTVGDLTMMARQEEQEGVRAEETEQSGGDGVRGMAVEQVGRVEEVVARGGGELEVGGDGSRRGSGGEADGSVCLICCEPGQGSSTTTSPFSSVPLCMISTGSSSSNLTTHTHSYTLSPPLSPCGGLPQSSPGYLLALLPCAHRLCPTCVLSLLAHAKPNSHVALPPSPVCPFCRCGIEGLDVAR
ncbi:unnamed protein product [Closterium sp. Yama58-4]|nr:unnamed protein product [Closterium sp. Yama58-4]